MISHLAFGQRLSSLQGRILIPKLYDPEIRAALDEAQAQFDLPELGDLLLPGEAGSRLGHWLRREHYGGGNIPYVRTSDIAEWRVRPDYKKGVSEDVYEKYRVQQDLRPFDLLLVAHGTYRVGDVGVLGESDLPAVLQDHVFRLRVDPASGVTWPLLLSALSTAFVRRQVRIRQFSADIIDKIGDRHLSIRVPLPRDETARLAVEVMVRNAVSEQDTILADLQAIAGSPLRMLRERAGTRLPFAVARSQVRRRILIPKYYDPALRDEVRLARRAGGWVRIADLVSADLLEIETGVEVGKLAYGTGDVPFVRTSDLVTWEITKDPRHSVAREYWERHSPKGALQEGDVVLVRDGTYLVGQTALVSEADLPALYCGGLYRLRTKDQATLSPHCLVGALNHPLVRQQIRARQFTRDVIDTLGRRLKELWIPDPRQAGPLSRVAGIFEGKAKVRAAMREAVRACEPMPPRGLSNRPGWSMR